MKKIVSIILLSVASLLSMAGVARNPLSIKAHYDLSLNDPYKTGSHVPGLEVTSGESMDLGVDLGIQFFNKGRWTLTANAGLCWSQGSQRFSADRMSYCYEAGPEADMDGESYLRYTTVDRLDQKINNRYITIPVYLDAEFRIMDWLGVYGRAGFRYGFTCGSSVSGVTGSYSAYGVYPQFDNLMIDAEWMNDFGHHDITNDGVSKPGTEGMITQLMCGAGIKVRIFKPLWLEAGVNYITGGNILTCDIPKIENGKISADKAPVAYTVKNGAQIKSLSSTLSKNSFSQLSLSIGLVYKF